MKKSFCFLLLIGFLSSCSETELSDELRFVDVPSGINFFGREGGKDNESPAVMCNVNEFQLSETEISNRQFEKFVDETGYVTDAEKNGGFIFDQGWKHVQKANWRFPLGRKMEREDWIDLPVVQVSYRDALAFCKWVNCRLPTELEWEYASKRGNATSGRLNIDTGEHEVPQTMSVKSLKKNELGIYHQAGNVWEWCLDSYNSEIHDKLALISTTEPFEAFTGKSFDPENMDATDTLRVIKGGSFLCQQGHCMGYRPYARQSAEQSVAYFHIGFRVAKDKE